MRQAAASASSATPVECSRSHSDLRFVNAAMAMKGAGGHGEEAGLGQRAGISLEVVRSKELAEVPLGLAELPGEGREEAALPELRMVQKRNECEIPLASTRRNPRAR